MEKDEKQSPWLKVLKLFAEFLVAAITAFITASCVRLF